MRSPLTLADVAHLVGSPVRLRMLEGLRVKATLSAGELATLAGMSPQAASTHLSKLREAGLITLDEGYHGARQRVFRLADEQVARATEALSKLATPQPPHEPPQQNITGIICYGHLGGTAGHTLLGALLEHRMLILLPYRFGPADDYQITVQGERFLGKLGLDLSRLCNPRAFCVRRCRNVAEADAHLAGSVGRALTHTFLERGWLVKREGRSCVLTAEAGLTLAERFSLTF